MSDRMDRDATPEHDLSPAEWSTRDEDTPGDWERREFEFSGNFRLRAKWVLPHGVGDSNDAIVTIRPFKSYDDAPGFPDCHSVKLLDYTARHPPAITTFGRSPSETEYVDDALDLALELMADFEENAADADQQAGEVVAVDELERGDEVRLNEWGGRLTVVDVGDEWVQTHGWESDRGRSSGVDVQLLTGGEQEMYRVSGSSPRTIDHLRRFE